MNKRVIQRGKDCSICGRDVWSLSRNGLRYMMIANHADTMLSVVKERNVCGIKHQNLELCLACFETAVGLEEYYDKFYYDILRDDLKELRLIVKNIIANDEFVDQAGDIRVEGDYFPKEFITKLLEA